MSWYKKTHFFYSGGSRAPLKQRLLKVEGVVESSGIRMSIFIWFRLGRTRGEKPKWITAVVHFGQDDQ